jgi:DNA-binding beta-propeller fold protein YncE
MSDSVSIMAADSGRRLFEVAVGRAPRFIAQTPDGSRLIVGDGLARGVTIVDPRIGRVVETRNLGRAGVIREVACSHDGRWAFVNQLISHDEQITLQIERGWINSNGIAVLDLEQPGHYVTLPLDSLINGAANPWGLAVSRDDQRLYVSLAGVHEIAIVDMPRMLELVAQTTPWTS